MAKGKAGKKGKKAADTPEQEVSSFLNQVVDNEPLSDMSPVTKFVQSHNDDVAVTPKVAAGKKEGKGKKGKNSVKF